MFNHRPSGGRGFSGHGRNRGASHSYNSRSSFSGNRRSRFMPKALDSRMFVRAAMPQLQEEVIVQRSFSDYDLSEQMLRNIQAKGYVTPTPIQDQALEAALAGKDVLGLADTGTGKTAVFALAVIKKIIENPNDTSLVVAPTRELAVQIRDEIRSLSGGLQVYASLFIGGSDIRRQLDELRRRPNVYIGTPGRLRDLYNRRALNLNNTHTVVLDEVDRMLDMGFVHEITELLSFLPKNHQTLLFSATIDQKVESIALQFMNNPEKISVKTNAGSLNVDQNIIRVSGKQGKFAVLSDLLAKTSFSKVLIFGRTKYGVEEIAISLQKSGFSADSIHGDKRQNQRENVLRKFKENQIRILCATDVAARGIDVKDITHVINFDQPATYEDYIHRIGRTGRAGKSGIALTFVD
ncbi:MAG TPA: DEAD/DEAH box helicase [Spirochaetia bacterium]|nr:DEAD/DEAH box helicase [Spirochaetia bacterium]